MPRNTLIFISLILFVSCTKKEQKADAYGNFETTTTIVSAQGNGPLLAFNIDEGDSLSAGEKVGYIDTLQIQLQQEQLEAKINSLRSQLPEASIQLQVIDQELSYAKTEQTRIENLLADEAATPKQKDDIDAKIALLQKKYASLRSSLSVQSGAILSQMKPLQIQVKELADKIKRYVITNPLEGVVLTKYAMPHEVVGYGKPLYQIGDLSNMILRAYITGNQLPMVKIGQTVTVLTDAPNEGSHQWTGRVTWIAEESEFTPKQIQTKEERVNRVYAIKVSVKNDGTIKIGMPGEVRFTSKNESEVAKINK